MRALLAGILTIVLLTSSALAGVIGKVESIGFGSYVRPDCWVPMVIQTNSDEPGPVEFDLQVVQHDLDGDEVVYTRSKITVNPGSQSFWTYFKPEPVNGGIPAQGSPNSGDLAKRLRIFLADPESKKRIVQIATAGNLPQGLEFGDYATSQGQKLMVVVGRAPNLREYDTRLSEQRLRPLIGTMELSFFVRSDVRHLPEHAIGYEMVDAVIWSDAEISRMSPAQMRALRQYVRGGGRLVVIQNAEMARFEPLAEFLPVTVEKIEERETAEPLKSILLPPNEKPPLDPRNKRPVDPFRAVQGPFRAARATALPDAVVEAWLEWPDQSQTPLIARRLFGTGCVSWIAQDITDPSIAIAEHGWPRVWEQLLGWNNAQLELTSTFKDIDEERRMRDRWTSGAMTEIGAAFQKGADLEGKTAALISVAFVFFITYWLIAGPGSYLFLAARRKTHWSWFAYGAIAVVATVLTMLIAQLLLRGPAQVRHLTLVRVRCDDGSPAQMFSRMGVYLPEDTTASLTLASRDASLPATITPLVVDPRYAGSRSVPERDSSYEVPIISDDAETIGIEVPFRSTLKKLQAQWHGAPSGRLSGKPVLSDTPELISGSITNNTGADLQRVTMVFPYPGKPDYVMYLGDWKKGQTIDLQQVWKKLKPDPALTLSGEPKRAGLNFVYTWLYDDLRVGRTSMSTHLPLDDAALGFPRSFPLASLFDRLQPMTNLGSDQNRVDIVRRGMRRWDVSPALAAGAMVVLAQSPQAPLPLPLEVDGSAPEGYGNIFWQFVVPLDRSQVKHLEKEEPETAG